MERFVLILVLSLLTGCASNPFKSTPPVNLVKDLQKTEFSPITPIQATCCEKVTKVTCEGKVFGGFTAGQLNQLRQLYVANKANTKLVNSLNDVAAKLSESQNRTLEVCGNIEDQLNSAIAESDAKSKEIFKLKVRIWIERITYFVTIIAIIQ